MRLLRFVPVLGVVMAFAPPHAALLAAAKRPKGYVPAPPVVKYDYGQIDPSINGGGAYVSAYTDAANQTVHLPPNPHPLMRAHEVGHLFDSEVLSDGDRRYFAKLMHAPAGPWDHGAAYGKVEGEVSPNEWFADYYGAAASRLDGLNGHATGATFAVITPRRMRNFLAAIDRLGRRRGLAAYQSPSE